MVSLPCCHKSDSQPKPFWSFNNFCSTKNIFWCYVARAQSFLLFHKNCHGSFASFPCSLPRECPRSWAFSLCCCSILYCFYAESTLLFYHVVFFYFLSSSMSSLTRSAAKHQSCSEEMNISKILSHDSTWAFVKSSEINAQHVESLLRSFEHPAQQHLNKHSTCWELVQWTNPVHLHAS